MPIMDRYLKEEQKQSTDYSWYTFILFNVNVIFYIFDAYILINRSNSHVITQPTHCQHVYWPCVRYPHSQALKILNFSFQNSEVSTTRYAFFYISRKTTHARHLTNKQTKVDPYLYTKCKCHSPFPWGGSRLPDASKSSSLAYKNEMKIQEKKKKEKKSVWVCCLYFTSINIEYTHSSCVYKHCIYIYIEAERRRKEI